MDPFGGFLEKGCEFSTFFWERQKTLRQANRYGVITNTYTSQKSSHHHHHHHKGKESWMFHLIRRAQDSMWEHFIK